MFQLEQAGAGWVPVPVERSGCRNTVARGKPTQRVRAMAGGAERAGMRELPTAVTFYWRFSYIDSMQ